MPTTCCCIGDADSQEREHREVTLHRIATSKCFVNALLVKIVVVRSDFVGDFTLLKDRANSCANGLNLRLSC